MKSHAMINWIKITRLLKVFSKNMNLSLVKRIISKDIPTQLCAYLAFFISTRQPVDLQ
jgi:hypothetical protein